MFILNCSCSQKKPNYIKLLLKINNRDYRDIDSSDLDYYITFHNHSKWRNRISGIKMRVYVYYSHMHEILRTYKVVESFAISRRCSIRYQYTCVPMARVTRISLRIGHGVRKSSNARGWDNVCSEAAYRQVYTYTVQRTCRHALERQTR